MPIIDFHNHYYPPAYLDALRSRARSVTVGVDAEGNPLLHYPGDYNIVVPRASRHRLPGAGARRARRRPPGRHADDAGHARRDAGSARRDLAALVNDAFAEVVATRGGASPRWPRCR